MEGVSATNGAPTKRQKELNAEKAPTIRPIGWYSCARHPSPKQGKDEREERKRWETAGYKGKLFLDSPQNITTTHYYCNIHH